MNRILDARDSAAKKLHDTNRGFTRMFKRLFWNYGIAKIYFKTIERFAKVFESIGFVFGYIWHLILSGTVHSSAAQSIRKARDKTQKKVNRSWEDFATNLSDKAEKSIFTSWLVKIFKIFRRMFRTLFGFSIDWLWTRNFWLLLGAVPATLLTLPVAYFLFRIPFMSTAGLSKSYQKAVQGAIDANDFDAVSLYNRRIAQLGNRPLNSMAYRSALKLAEKGKLTEAYDQIQALASPSSPGFEPTHLWIAHHLRTGDIRTDDQTDKEVNDLVKRHLKHALKLNPENSSAAQMLASTYVASDQKELARKTLDEYKQAFKDPLIRVRAAGLYQLLGDNETAGTLLRSAAEQSKTQEQFGNELPPIHYFGRAEIELAQGNLQKAIKALETGREAHPDDESLGKFLVSLLVMRFDATSSWLTASERMTKLSEMLSITPTNGEVLHRIAGLAESPVVAAKATEHLQTALLNEDSDKADVFNLLGSAYAVQGDMEKSREAYEKVLEHTSTDAEAYNNLAWLYSQVPPLKMETALEFSRKAVALEPTNPHYRDTLGHIYMQTEKWEDAVKELRKALNGMPDNKKTHKAIASCYTKLGNRDLATQHSQFAKQ